MYTNCIRRGQQLEKNNMLKKLFTSNARIKLLKIFLLNPGEEYFIRELTRILDEQINSVRRELDNLKQVGLLKAKVKNRKKYYRVNTGFIFFNELKSMIEKNQRGESKLASDIAKLGDVKILALTGRFIGEENEPLDMLVVGNIDNAKLSNYLNTTKETNHNVKFAIMSEDDFKYRQDCNDKFIVQLMTGEKNQILIKNI